eukprot:6685404-Lingulodinium_polyedra.AAC.1
MTAFWSPHMGLRSTEHSCVLVCVLVWASAFSNAQQHRTQPSHASKPTTAAGHCRPAHDIGL